MHLSLCLPATNPGRTLSVIATMVFGRRIDGKPCLVYLNSQFHCYFFLKVLIFFKSYWICFYSFGTN